MSSSDETGSAVRAPRPERPAGADAELLRRLCAPATPPRDVLRAAVRNKSGQELAGLVELAERLRVLGLVGQRLGADELTRAALGPDLVRRLERRRAAARLRVAVLGRLGGTLLRALDAADVPAAFVHGLAAAALYDEGVRDVRSIDVLVPPDRLPVVRATLRKLGYHSTGPTSFLLGVRVDGEKPRVNVVRSDHLDIATTGALLDQREEQAVPGVGEPLTVLGPAGAVWVDLARIGVATSPGELPRTWHVHVDAATRLGPSGAIPPVVLASLIGPVGAGRDVLRWMWPTPTGVDRLDTTPERVDIPQQW